MSHAALRSTAGAVLLLVLCATVQAATSTTVILHAVADNSMYSEADAVSDGAGPYIWVGQTHVGNNRRALVRFDLSAVPPGSVVVAARLRIAMSKSISVGRVVEVRRLLASWGEGTSTGGAGGAGGAATAADVTWGFRFFGGRVPWTVPGGDFITGPPSVSTRVDFSGVTWTWSSAGLASDVQLWLASPADNFGWILIGDEAERSAMRFESRNGFTGPVLELDVIPASANVPIPLPWLIVGGCLMLGVLLGRRR
jgi:hypothetical protein